MSSNEATGPTGVEEKAALAAIRAKLLGRVDPTELSRYRLLHRIGEGGWGTVYAGHDPQLDRRVAIKLVRARKESEAARVRFRREAQTLAVLRHPNIVEVYDVGTIVDDDGRERLFVVMELLDGATLREWLRAGPRGRDAILDTFAKAGAGLAAAHDAGIVHRDFKPDNVFVAKDGGVKVLDFGLARILDDVGDSSGAMTASISLSGSMTLTGDVLGTPRYMAPEQHDGHAATESSDQYAFCLSLYEALAGAYPFEVSSPGSLGDLKRSRRVGPLLRGHRIPRVLRRRVLRGMNPKPSDRYPSTHAMLAAVEGARARTIRLLAIGAAATGVLAAGGVAVAGAESSVCAGVPELERVWTDSSVVLARQGVMRHGATGAQQVWDRVEAELGGNVDRWTSERLAACELHEQGGISDQEFDLSQRCYSRRATALRALLQTFAEAERPLTATAIGKARGVEQAAACTSDRTNVVDDSPRARALSQKLIEIHVRIGTNEAEQEVELAEVAVAEARRLGNEGILAEALFACGWLYRDLGRWEDAIDLLEEALWRAELTGNLPLAARIVPDLLYATQRVRSLDDETIAKRLAVLERADHPRHWGAALVVLGNAAMVRNKYEDAEQHFLRARQILEEGDEIPSLAYAESKTGLASVYARWERYDEAQALVEEALQDLEALGGPLEPGRAYAFERLASIHHRRKDLEAAAKYYERSVELFDAVYSEGHPDSVWPRSVLAMVWYQQGHIDQALRAHKIALDTVLRRPSNDMTGTILANHALLLRETGDFDAALRHYEQALAIFEKASGPESSNVQGLKEDIAKLEERRRG